MSEDLEFQLSKERQHLCDELKTFRDSGELINGYASESRRLWALWLLRRLDAIDRLLWEDDEEDT